MLSATNPVHTNKKLDTENEESGYTESYMTFFQGET